MGNSKVSKTALNRGCDSLVATSYLTFLQQTNGIPSHFGKGRLGLLDFGKGE